MILNVNASFNFQNVPEDIKELKWQWGITDPKLKKGESPGWWVESFWPFLPPRGYVPISKKAPERVTDTFDKQRRLGSTGMLCPQITKGEGELVNPSPSFSYKTEGLQARSNNKLKIHPAKRLQLVFDHLKLWNLIHVILNYKSPQAPDRSKYTSSLEENNVILTTNNVYY